MLEKPKLDSASRNGLCSYSMALKGPSGKIHIHQFESDEQEDVILASAKGLAIKFSVGYVQAKRGSSVPPGLHLTRLYSGAAGSETDRLQQFTGFPTLPTSLENRLSRKHQGVSHTGKWLAPIQCLANDDHIDAALDVLYDRVDASLKKKQFQKIDDVLSEVDVNTLSVDILLGLLTATYPAKSKLPSRVAFFSAAEAAIKARGEWEDGLLAGLEP